MQLCIQHHFSVPPATGLGDQRIQQQRPDSLASPGTAHGHAADVTIRQQTAGTHRLPVSRIGNGMQTTGVARVQFFFQWHLLLIDKDLQADAAGFGAQVIPGAGDDTPACSVLRYFMRRHRMAQGEIQHLGQPVRKIGDPVIAAFDDALTAARETGLHVPPVQDFITGGCQQEIALRVGQDRDVRLGLRQFVDMNRQKFERLITMKGPVRPDLGGQIPGRMDDRIEQHGTTAEAFGQPGRIKAAQGGADEGEAINGHAALAVDDNRSQAFPYQFKRQIQCRSRTGGQLGTAPVGRQTTFGHGLSHQTGLEGVGRRAESVQIENHVDAAFRVPEGARRSLWRILSGQTR